MTYEWSRIFARRNCSREATPLILFGLGLLVVYLTLSAQYESFVLPFIILLAVPMACSARSRPNGSRGLQNDVYCQVGLVMLVGLACKNAILIVEFAEQLRERGMTIASTPPSKPPASACAHSHDVLRLHSRRRSAGLGQGAGARPPLRGHHRLRRHD